MAERRYPRPRSPPIIHSGRSSLPNFSYPYPEVYPIPIRNDLGAMPRSGADRVPMQAPVVSTYTIKPEPLIIRDPPDRASSRHRRSTFDSLSRPTIVNAEPRSPTIHGGAGRPPSPIYDSYRSSSEGGEYITIPASSGKRLGHPRGTYSATMDNGDMHKLARDGGSRGLGVGSGRERARYPTQHRPVYPEALVRHPDTVADDYGDDGYGYTNPRDLFQYDMSRPLRYSQYRDNPDGLKPRRPVSISGYADIAPRSFDNRERRPPPATRGLGKLATRVPPYDPQPVRSPRKEQFYDADPPRKEQFYNVEPPRSQTYRRPVTIYQDRPRRDEYYDPRDNELRERRERREYSKRHDERGEYRERPYRNEANGYDKKREYDKKNDYERENESGFDDRAERKNTYDGVGLSQKDYDKRNDHDRKDDHDDRKERKKDRTAAGISLAAAALGVGTAAKNAKHDDSDGDKNDSDEQKRRKDVEEHRRRREHRDDRTVDLTGRDPRERYGPRQDKDTVTDDKGDVKEPYQLKEDMPVDLAGRNPQEKPSSRDIGDGGQESREHSRNKSEPVVTSSTPGSREGSPPPGDVTGRHRTRKERGPGTDIPFNPTNIMDLRALKDAVNKKDEGSNKEASVPPTVPPETVREGSFERKREPGSTQPSSRESRSKRETPDSDEERRPTPRVVSPPREVKKPEENKPRGILRPPREKFPEDPAPIREGVAPLKDAKKDGVPPDARWTKISRRMVNPEALEAGKERFEAREDFVIVLRVLTKEEIQAYAVATQKIRAAREQVDREDREEREERHRRRRERHERHRREREREREEWERHHRERDDNHEYDHDHKKLKKERDSHSESDTSPDDDPSQKLIESQKSRRIVPDPPVPLPTKPGPESSLKENPDRPGTYTGYVRNPPRKDGWT